MAGRQERARRRLEARRKVRDAVAGTIRLAREAALGIEVPSERPSGELMADYQFASRVLAAAEELGCVRRRLALWRLRAVVGSYAYEVAQDVPAVDQRDPTNILSAAMVNDAKNQRFENRTLAGLRRRAFGDNSGDIDSAALAKLIKVLGRIARCKWW